MVKVTRSHNRFLDSKIDRSKEKSYILKEFVETIFFFFSESQTESDLDGSENFP